MVGISLQKRAKFKIDLCAVPVQPVRQLISAITELPRRRPRDVRGDAGQQPADAVLRGHGLQERRGGIQPGIQPGRGDGGRPSDRTAGERRLQVRQQSLKWSLFSFGGVPDFRKQGRFYPSEPPPSRTSMASTFLHRNSWNSFPSVYPASNVKWFHSFFLLLNKPCCCCLSCHLLK